MSRTPKTKSSITNPTPGPRPCREELEAMCMGLPANTRGVDECRVRLNLAKNFIHRWLKGPIAGIPPIPHFPMEDGQHIFSTGLVMTWLFQWFPPGSGPGVTRGGARNRRDEAQLRQDVISGSGPGLLDRLRAKWLAAQG